MNFAILFLQLRNKCVKKHMIAAGPDLLPTPIAYQAGINETGNPGGFWTHRMITTYTHINATAILNYFALIISLYANVILQSLIYPLIYVLLGERYLQPSLFTLPGSAVWSPICPGHRLDACTSNCCLYVDASLPIKLIRYATVVRYLYWGKISSNGSVH